MNNSFKFNSEDKPYFPEAIYYEDADYLEYIREDLTPVYRRVDQFLTLLLTLEDRKLVGLKLKGFRNIYNRYSSEQNDSEFPKLMTVLETVYTEIYNNLFEEQKREQAYKDAIKIAQHDDVIITNLPKAIAL
ncbi:MAG: hypothetical protein ABJM86_03950 [Hyphomicrobiales bacterium]